MKTVFAPGKRRPTLSALFLALALALAGERAAADPASDLASRLSEIQLGTSFVRLRLNVRDSSGKQTASLQVQIKERRTADSADVLYQILWPKERKGESVLLNQSGREAPTGYRFVLPDQLTALKSADLDDGLFGSDLAFRDLIENFFSWKEQKIVGSAEIQGVECQILESRPGREQPSSYGTVRSWIDTRRLVPLRVEKYDRKGKLVRRIETTRVNKNDNGHHIPSTLEIRRSDGTTATELEGSRNKLNVSYGDDSFTVPKMTDLAAPGR